MDVQPRLGSYAQISLLGLAALDIATWVFPQAGQLGIALWILSFLILFAYATHSFFKALISLGVSKNFFTLLAIAVTFGGVLFRLPFFFSTSAETTQQIHCVIETISANQDWGYLSTCFLSYPARQYVVPALPSFLFGPSTLNLHFGGSLYFLLAILAFAGQLRLWLKDSALGDIATMAAFALLLHLHHLTYFLFYFEQSYFPFAFSLLLMAIVLNLMRDKSESAVSLCMLTAYWMCFLYPASLATLGLAYVLWGLSWFHAPIRKLIFSKMGLIMFFAVGEGLVSSLLHRGDVRLFRGEQTDLGWYKQRLTEALQYFLDPHSTAHPYSSLVGQLCLGLCLILLLIGFVRRLNILLGLWALAVISLAELSKGYAVYSVDFSFHRAMVMYPALLLVFAEFIAFLKVKPTLVIVLVSVLLGSGIFERERKLESRSFSDHSSFTNLDFIQKLPTFIPNYSADKSYFFIFEMAMEQPFLSLRDTSRYFMPSLASQMTKDLCKPRTRANFNPAFKFDAIFLVSREPHPCPNISFRKVTLTNETIYIADTNYANFLEEAPNSPHKTVQAF